MGVCWSRTKRGRYVWKDDPRMFIQKMKQLEQEMSAILKQREEETEVYERELMLFAFRETEWKRDREEVKGLRRSLEDREERIRRMEVEPGITDKSEQDNHTSTTTTCSTLLLVENIREERPTRDEAVEKWKTLYLAIKNELDHLIQTTHQGTLNWRADDEDLMEDLQKELKAKDETIQVLKAQLASMEDEDYKRKREVDILRQSLRIMSINSRHSSAKVKKLSTNSIRFTKGLSKLAFLN